MNIQVKPQKEMNLVFFDKMHKFLKNKINNISTKYNDICTKYGCEIETETETETEPIHNNKILDTKTEMFISESKKKFGDRFDYSLTKYNGTTKKLAVICKLHGKCEQLPSNHFRYIHGCAECSRNFSKIDINEMLRKANIIHANKYDYSEVIYENKHKRVNIICPKHGIYQKTIKDHVYLKQGCQLCAKEERNGKKTKIITTESFIEEASTKHNFKYNYSEVKYINAKKKVKIDCPIHGFFWQDPYSHLRIGRGCPICNTGTPMTTDFFIKRCREIHGDIYNYDKVNYINSKTNVTITCRKHGEFEQTPDSHLNKSSRCPICANKSVSMLLSDTTENFIKKSKYIHGNKCMTKLFIVVTITQ